MKIKDFDKKENQKIEIISRAFILVDNKVLLCKLVGRDYYFFPGGHVEFGENTKKAMTREIKEELDATIKNLSFIGVVEHAYVDSSGRKYQQINLVFTGRIEEADLQSKEDHIEFVLKDLKSFAKEKVLPRTLRDALLEWLKNKKPFYREWEE